MSQKHLELNRSQLNSMTDFPSHSDTFNLRVKKTQIIRITMKTLPFNPNIQSLDHSFGLPLFAPLSSPTVTFVYLAS